MLRRNSTCHGSSKMYLRRSLSARLRPPSEFESPPTPAFRIREPPVRLPRSSFYLVSLLITHAATHFITALKP